MDCLDKKYWDTLEGRYPKTMNHFKASIDAYKELVNWPVLFNEGMQSTVIKTPSGVHSHTDLNYTVKFHNIPLELQIGVIYKYCQFFYEGNNLLCPDPSDILIDGLYLEKTGRNIEFFFRFIETTL